MKHSYTAIVARSFIAGLLLVGWGSATAISFPERTIQMVVGFPGGQSTDLAARQIAKGMSDILKESVIVLNQPGAGGGISHRTVKFAAPDGYTLVMGSTGTLAINPSLYSNLPYDPLEDFEPIVLATATPHVLFVSGKSPINNLKELVAYAKANPGIVAYGSAGSGTTGHIAMELLKKETDIDMLHIPYKGSPAMVNGVIGGDVIVGFEPISTLIAMQESGLVKFLGIGTLTRHPGFPELTTLAEQGLPKLEVVPWTAILAPKGTPAPIIEKLNIVINEVLKDPELVAEYNRNGRSILGGSSSDAKNHLEREHARWAEAVKISGSKVD